MPIEDRHRRSIRPPLTVAALLAALGIAGFLFMRNGARVPDDGGPIPAGAASVPDAPRPVAAPSAPGAEASSVAVAAPLPGNAARPAPAWQHSLQPAVVVAIRADSLSAYQAQVEHWACESEQCVGNLRVPPTVEAGRTGDMSAAAKIFDNLKGEMARNGVDVALGSVHRGPQGLAIAFEFTPGAAAKGRFYTDAEIAAIRLESFEQGSKSRGQDAAH